MVIAEPSQDRWMYPSNSTPGTRPQASTFSALPGSAGLDDRWGFFLFAFDTGPAVPPGLPPEIYRIRSVKFPRPSAKTARSPSIRLTIHGRPTARPPFLPR